MRSLLKLWLHSARKCSAVVDLTSHAMTLRRTSVAMKPPLIIGLLALVYSVKGDIEIKEVLNNTSLQLQCVGDGNLTWRFEPEQLRYNFQGLQANENITEPYRGRAMLLFKPHRLVIKINNSRFEDSGSYDCYEDDVLKTSTRVYVHDKDPCENLFIPLEESARYLLTIRVEIGVDFVIPCRPTRPDIVVSLESEQEEDIDQEYDSRHGYFFKNASIQKNNGFWTCEARNPGCSNKQHTEKMLVYVEAYVSDFKRPIIQESSPKVVYVGSQACIECKIESQTSRRENLQWIGPNREVINAGGHYLIQESDNRVGRETLNLWIVSVLSINNVTKKDEGEYTCRVLGNSELNTTLKLKVADESSRIRIDIPENQRVFKMNESDIANTPAIKWTVTLNPPDVKTKWFSPSGTELQTSFKYRSYTSSNIKQKNFVIYKPNLLDAGTYRVEAYTTESRASLNLTLVINSAPRVQIPNSIAYYKPGFNYTFKCLSSGQPRTNLSWHFQCINNNKLIDCSKMIQTSQKNPNEIYLTANYSGIVTCKACNMMGCGENSTEMIISEYKEGVGVIPSADVIYESDHFYFECIVPSYPCERKWEWHFQRNETANAEILSSGTGTGTKLVNSKLHYSYSSKVIFESVNRSSNGIYTCTAKCKPEQNKQIKQRFYLKTRPIIKPQFRNPGVKLEHSAIEGTVVQLDCDTDSDPLPTVSWTIKKTPIENLNLTFSTRFTLVNNNMVLKILPVLIDDEGIYKCEIRSKNSEIERIFKLSVQSKRKKWDPVILIPIIIVLVLLVVIVLYLLRAIKQEKLKVQQLTAQEVRLFLEGATENIDLSLALDQQADLLPYNPNYEYPRENLKLGRQLGVGAFGRVVRGEASTPLFGATQDFDNPHEDFDPHDPTVVAVKMVKPNAELSQIKALMTELKILIHVGKHLNVVNLLGACTTNLCNKELLVIVEYCRYGNMHTYLLRQRDNYVDQVNHLKDTLDFTIGSSDDDETHYENHSVILDNKQVLFKKETRTIIYDPQPDADSRYHGEATSTTDGSNVTEHWTTKYRGDFKGELKRITTKDLVCWSYQVARGMQYLATRRIVHADLAARNILLAEHNVVKICDFGLARNLYNDANYLKKGDDPLPVKWMAIESIQDRVFSSESDVWSFGIVLWEFFTLAKTPYPGIPLDEHFLRRLVDGYRMEKPNYSTLQIYKIMRKCWDTDPSKRPNFNELVNQLGQILDDNVKQFYLELSGPYIRMNSLQQEYDQDMRNSTMKEPMAKKEAVPVVGENPMNVVVNPSYMLLQNAPQVSTTYVNLEKTPEEEGKLAVDEPEGYLKMSPVMPKQPKGSSRSTKLSVGSSIQA